MRDIVSPLSGIRSPFGERRTAFSPAALFALAEPGVWYDPSDVANLDWRRNLLTFTEQFDNAAWTKTNLTVSANNSTAPDGLVTADLFAETTATGEHNAAVSTLSVTSGTSYTASFYAKYTNRQYIIFRSNIGATGAGTFANSAFDIQNGSVFSSGSGHTCSITSVGNGWYRCIVTMTPTWTGTTGVFAIGMTTNGSTFSYTGDAANTVLIWGAQLELGSTATTYQPITDVNSQTVALFPNATLYQDTAGTTPVTTPGQSVALALDKSRGLVLGSELAVNGDFASGLTGWTAASTGTGSATAPSGALIVSGTDASNRGIISQSITTVAGRTYAITFAVISATGAGSAVIAASTTSGATFNLGFTDSNATARRLLFVASGATSSVNIYTSGSATVTIDNISVRELPGNHATQATAGSRPLYALLPANGVRNLANGSADVGNATFWGTSSTVNGITYTRVASGLDTDGLPYADYTVTGTATAQTDLGTYSTSQSRSAMVVGQTLNNSFRAQIIAGTVPPANCGVISRIVAENSSFVGVETFSSAVTAPLTETAVTISGTITNATTAFARGTALITTANGATVNYTVRIKALQFELGSTRTAYQFNYSNVNIAQPPFAQVGALLFDGVDDFLQTPSVDFAGYEQLGSELVTNGDFSSATGWTQQTGWTIGSGVLTGNVASATFASTFRGIAFTAGQTYSVTFTVTSYTSGEVRAVLGGTTDVFGVARTSAGTFTQVLTAVAGSNSIAIQAGNAGFVGTIDNISVKEVLRPADKMTVFAGVRKLSDAARGVLVELAASTTNSFRIDAPSASATTNYLFVSFGSVAVGAQAVATSPDTSVITGQGDISGDLVSVRRNGAAAGSSTSDQGTGNYSNAPIYIGRRSGTTLPFNGYLYSLIVRGAATSTDVIGLTERWVNSRTGAY